MASNKGIPPQLSNFAYNIPLTTRDPVWLEGQHDFERIDTAPDKPCGDHGQDLTLRGLDRGGPVFSSKRLPFPKPAVGMQVGLGRRSSLLKALRGARLRVDDSR